MPATLFKNIRVVVASDGTAGLVVQEETGAWRSIAIDPKLDARLLDTHLVALLPEANLLTTPDWQTQEVVPAERALGLGDSAVPRSDT